MYDVGIVYRLVMETLVRLKRIAMTEKTLILRPLPSFSLLLTENTESWELIGRGTCIP